MLKYLYNNVVFQEIPDEVSLAVSISGCGIHCKGCHSPELWKDVGKPLTWGSLNALMNINKGITCLLLMGGEHDLDTLTDLFYHAHRYIRTAWYSGLKEVPANHLALYDYLDYIKLGPYIQDLGGLDSPATNQKLYRIHFLKECDEKENRLHGLEDITYKFWRNDKKNE